MENKQTVKIEFSKKIYILNIILVIFVVISSLTLIALSGRLGLTDLSPLSVICTSAFGELAIHSGFYANKAKAENVIKISKQIGNIDNEKEASYLKNNLTQFLLLLQVNR